MIARVSPPLHHGKESYQGHCGTGRRLGAAKCHSSALSSLLLPRGRLVPAAMAMGEDMASAPVTASLLPATAGAASICASNPLSWRGSSPGRNCRVLTPALCSGTEGAPAYHRHSPLVPSNSMRRPPPSSLLHIPTSHFSIQHVCT